MGPVSQPWNFRIDPASSGSDLVCIRELFREYAASLQISLCFQNFEEELANLPGKYAPPRGTLLLAREGSRAVGCVALRELGANASEMKRLYVRPVARKRGLGRALAFASIQAARELGYQCMRLDTLSSMTGAISLYRSLGFSQIEPYYHNPSEQAVFMELQLGPAVGPQVLLQDKGS